MAKILLKNVRLSYPALFTRAVHEGKEGKYEATLLLNKDDHADVIKQLRIQIKGLITNELKLKGLKAENICLRDGDLRKDEEGNQVEGYENCWSLKASTMKKPSVFDRDKTPLTGDTEKPYAGCYVNAIVDFWVQDNAYGKKINANLFGVQFYRDGEAFGSVAATADDFEDFGDDDDFGDEEFGDDESDEY